MKRTKIQRQDPGEAGASVVRMLAALGLLGGAAILEHGLSDELPYFAIGAVVFCVGLVALRLPNLFWTARRASAASSEQETAELAVQGQKRIQ